ncbi:archaeosortase/exosortase family protein [Candidatus Woesearchaeota archaeon]|nr:archaeosortase/exosortase family protein [Candidatus Woesearchaeota archaeon]
MEWVNGWAKVPWFFRRYISFVLVTLLLLPLFLSIFINADGYHFQLRTVFLLQRMYVIFSALLLVLLITSHEKIKGYEPRKRDWKEPLAFALLAGLLFMLAFSTQIDYDHILSHGAEITDRMNFDAERWLSPRILSDTDINPNRLYWLEDDSDVLARQVTLDKIPGNPEVRFHSYWADLDGNGAFSDCMITLGINNHSIDISEEYADSLRTSSTSQYPETDHWVIIKVNQSLLMQGPNLLYLQKRCRDSISISSQDAYVNHQSYAFHDGKWDNLYYNELAFFIQQDDDATASILFKTGFILRAIALLFLFIAFFGLDFIWFIFQKAKIEIGFSFVYSIIMYWFSQYIRNYWLILSKLVSYGAYILMKISFLQPVLDFSDPSLPWLGVPEFMVGMADTCSGIDSLAYFILAYSLLVAINWRSINIKRAALLFIPGLLGALAMNVIRIYLLFIIGIYFSRDFALNAYHTNAGMVLFIIYFVIFWQLSLRFMTCGKPWKDEGHKGRQKREKKRTC